MDRGAWRATVHGVAELDMTEQLTLLLFFFFHKESEKKVSKTGQGWVISVPGSTTGSCRVPEGVG